MHDDVGSSLSEIAILSELAKRKPEEAGGHVEQISERASELIDNVSEIVWAMNPKNDTLDNFIGHLRRYAVKYLNIAGIACEFVAPEEIPAYPLQAELRRNLFLVVKEALHNIVKYAGAIKVTICVELQARRMEIRIEDNGRGFKPGEQRGGGDGLLNMRKRMTDIDGEFQIDSVSEGGTRILFAVPISSLGGFLPIT